MADEPRRKLRSVDDIITDLNEIASDPDSGPDRFRSLKMLHSINTANAQVLHQPMLKSDRMERWIRLMRPAGREEVEEAFHRSFGLNQKPNTPIRARAESLNEETLYRISKVKTVKQFHKLCPELKKSGHPGYRSGANELEKIQYFQKRATEYFVDKMNMEVPVSGFTEHTAVEAQDAEQPVQAGPESN